MIDRLLAALVLGAGVSAALAAGPKSAPVSVTLPLGADSLPGGERARAVNDNCLACHSSEMISMQPALSKAVWTEEVMKMRKVYGAPVADQDVPAIVDYLVSLKPQ